MCDYFDSAHNHNHGPTYLFVCIIIVLADKAALSILLTYGCIYPLALKFWVVLLKFYWPIVGELPITWELLFGFSSTNHSIIISSTCIIKLCVITSLHTHWRVIQLWRSNPIYYAIEPPPLQISMLNFYVEFRGIRCIQRCTATKTNNTLGPGQNGCHFADDIFKLIFFNKNAWISIKIWNLFLRVQLKIFHHWFR